MKQNLSQKINYWLGVITLGVMLGFSIQLVRAWTEPTGTAPAGNVDAPINVGAIMQDKEGSLRVHGFRNYNQTLLDGNVGIGTTNPATKLDVNGTATINTVVTDGFKLNATGTTGKVLMATNDTGTASWQALPAVAGDNLGNHIATQPIAGGSGGNTPILLDSGASDQISFRWPQASATPTPVMNVNGSDYFLQRRPGNTNGNIGCVVGQVIENIGADGVAKCVDVSSGNVGINGSGTQYFLPRWRNTAGTILGDSMISETAAGTAATVNGSLKATGFRNFSYSLLDGQVGIGTTNPANGIELDVAGDIMADNVITDAFKMPTGKGNGYVLTSDANGVGTWKAAGGDWKDGEHCGISISGSDMDKVTVKCQGKDPGNEDDACPAGFVRAGGDFQSPGNRIMWTCVKGSNSYIDCDSTYTKSCTAWSSCAEIYPGMALCIGSRSRTCQTTSPGSCAASHKIKEACRPAGC